jgi:hypothetical protein
LFIFSGFYLEKLITSWESKVCNFIVVCKFYWLLE